jgi:hypothetical protein
MTASQNSLFTFSVKSFEIKNTRSLHKDTDFVSMSVAVGSKPPVTLPSKSMGNLNNGHYHVDLSIPDVEVHPTEAVSFVYSIVNAGYDKNVLEQKIKAAVTKAASDGATEGGKALGTAVGGPAGGAGGSVVGSKAGGWLVGKIVGIAFANCDGPVAGATHTYSGAQLSHLTAGGHTVTTTDDNKGTNSPRGCGSNSHYTVTWSVSGRPK